MSKRIPTTGGQGLAGNAFGSLSAAGLPSAPVPAPADKASPTAAAKGGRVHLTMEKSGRSGKTVTVLFGDGVERLDPGARDGLLKSLKGSLGCGGAVDGGRIELQGDVRERVAPVLRASGFQVR